MNNKAILESYLRVPSHMVPMEAFDKFRITLKDSEGEEYDIEFFKYEPQTDTYVFERGDINLIRSVFKDVEIEDRRAIVPMISNNVNTPQGHGLKLTATLRSGYMDEQSGEYKPGQTDVAEAIINGDGYGQIKAPPRFGKTITMIGITCLIQQKTLFLSHQVDLAEQAYKSFVKFTNLMDLEYQTGKQVVGIVKKWEDLDKFDVAIMPYQKFVSGKNADEMLEKYKNRFGVVFVDESHKAKADRYSTIVSSFNSRYRIGVSGTTEVKGDYHLINHYSLGPVVAEGFAPQIPCVVYTVETQVEVPYRPSKMFFTNSCTYLSRNFGRTQLQIDLLDAWAKQGHYIIAVSDRTKHINEIVNSLKQRGINAEPFHAKLFPKTKAGQKKREECLNRARSGETQVLVAMRSMVLGLDIPRLTAFFNLQPTSHPQNYYQEFCRVRTPFSEGEYNKNLAYIVDFLDDHFLLKNYYKARRKEYVRNNFEIYDNDFMRR